jgi:hypothetical protein
MALDFAEKATEAAEAGDLVGATMAAESAEFFETKTEEATEDVIEDVLGGEPPPPEETYEEEPAQEQDWKTDESSPSG